jgi:hypothetical protein
MARDYHHCSGTSPRSQKPGATQPSGSCRVFMYGFPRCESQTEFGKPATNTMQKNEDEESRSAPVWDTVNGIASAFRLSRNVQYQLVSEGIIKSKLVRIPGSKGPGQRLINVGSVMRFIEAQDTYAPAKMQRAMRKLARASVASRRAAKLKRKRRVKRAGKGGK